LFTAISKVDKKGRISIPIRLRAKLNLVEGRFVKITFRNNSLILVPDFDITSVKNVSAKTNGQSSVKASTRVRETRRPSAILGSGPRGEKYGGTKNGNKNKIW